MMNNNMLLKDAALFEIKYEGKDFYEPSTAGEVFWKENGVYLSAKQPVCAIRISWENSVTEPEKVFGDAWERGYGDLAWKNVDKNAIFPWYCAQIKNGTVYTYGVRTQPNAMCWWSISKEKITLTADVRCGTKGVCLQDRILHVADVVSEEYHEESQRALSLFCKKMCDAPRLPEHPIYGGNDWYCNYGHNSYEKIIEHTKRIVACAGESENPPYMVIDDGWQLCHFPSSKDEENYNGGPWKYCNRNFGDMQKLANEIRGIGARPGIWFRPLLTAEKMPESMILRTQYGKNVLDPSMPEVLEQITCDLKEIRKWGYELIKHDFTTFDIFGLWGFEMGNELTMGDWTFHDRTRTTAEIIKVLYHTIREAARDAVIIGCNTISHLSAGIFELQRTGDDTSGKEWAVTQKMGINTLAFRMCQHETFYLCDADCVGITKQVPWEKNKLWLDLLSKSGTPLFVSIAEDAYEKEVVDCVSQAFKRASRSVKASVPLDWEKTQLPQYWLSQFGTDVYEW